MLTLGGVFSARRQPRAVAWVSVVGIRRGHFLTHPAVSGGPVQGQGHHWAGTSCARSGGRQGAPLHPEPEAPGRSRLPNPAGRCPSPRAARGSTCRSEVPPPSPHRAFGSQTGPLRVISHSWSLPSTHWGFRKREPLQDVWEMTGEFNQIILV